MMEVEEIGKTATALVVAQEEKFDPKVAIGRLGYEKVFKLGEGTYGTVWCITEKGKRQALKIGKREVIDSEVKLLRRITHKNVIEVKKTHPMTMNTAFVMKLATCDLGQYVRSRPYKMEDTLKFMFQLFSGLDAIHKRNIIHGDIKPENLLWYKETGILKIADFGISVSFRKLPMKHDTMCTINYRPPEISLGIGYTPSIDIWSAGCLMYFLGTNGTQFLPNQVASMWPNATSGKYDPSRHLKFIWKHIRDIDPNDEDLLFFFSGLDEEFIEKQKSCYYKSIFSDSEKENLMWKTMAFNPTKRITASDALESDIFKNLQ